MASNLFFLRVGARPGDVLLLGVGARLGRLFLLASSNWRYLSTIALRSSSSMAGVKRLMRI